jgi:hypothetical protein
MRRPWRIGLLVAAALALPGVSLAQIGGPGTFAPTVPGANPGGAPAGALVPPGPPTAIPGGSTISPGLTPAIPGVGNYLPPGGSALTPGAGTPPGTVTGVPAAPRGMSTGGISGQAGMPASPPQVNELNPSAVGPPPGTTYGSGSYAVGGGSSFSTGAGGVGAQIQSPNAAVQPSSPYATPGATGIGAGTPGYGGVGIGAPGYTPGVGAPGYSPGGSLTH